jgi:hypothetical protein
VESGRAKIIAANVVVVAAAPAMLVKILIIGKASATATAHISHFNCCLSKLPENAKI